MAQGVAIIPCFSSLSASLCMPDTSAEGAKQKKKISQDFTELAWAISGLSDRVRTRLPLLPGSNAHPADHQVPVFGGSAHKCSRNGEHDDGCANNSRAWQDVCHETIDDEEAGKNVGKGRAGKDLVFDAQAVIVPVALIILFATEEVCMQIN